MFSITKKKLKQKLKEYLIFIKINMLEHRFSKYLGELNGKLFIYVELSSVRLLLFLILIFFFLKLSI